MLRRTVELNKEKKITKQKIKTRSLINYVQRSVQRKRKGISRDEAQAYKWAKRKKAKQK